MALSSVLNSATMIQILVGPNRKHFLVDEQLACSNSRYFNVNLARHTGKPHEKFVILKDEDPEVVKLFLAWLHFQTIDLDTHTIRYLEPRSQNFWRKRYFAIFKLWVFAERYGVPKLCNKLVTTFHEQASISGEDPGLAAIMWLWNNTTTDSGLRNLVIRSVALSPCLSRFNSKNAAVPSDLYLSILRQLPAYQGDPKQNSWHARWRQIDLCDFHFHPGGSDCYGETVETRRKSVRFVDQGCYELP